MEETNPKLAELLLRLESLGKKQSAFWVELRVLQDEINSLKLEQSKRSTEEKAPSQTPVSQDDFKWNLSDKSQASTKTFPSSIPEESTPKKQSVHPPRKGLSLEKFIGENLINKIGIIILIIGVAIGVKYSIENNLIQPSTRILISYLVGVGLSLLALKLKKNYHSYSAVLLSGGLAILYFTSYFAHSSYQLFSQPITFILMLVLTILGVLSSLKYNSQVIALIGLVGAYAIPFLLRSGTCNIPFFLSYVALINFGILVLTQKKLWKALSITSFALSWVIFIAWYINGYSAEKHFSLALIFNLLFFLINYLIILSYKLTHREKYSGEDILPIVLNALAFFLLGYLLLNDNSETDHLLGLFALCNALVHFVFSIVIKKKFQADQSLVYLIIGISLSFLCISAIIELEGPWLSSLLVVQGMVLFWVGRRKTLAFYEKIAYPFLVIALLALLDEWSVNYYDLKYYEGPLRFSALFNTSFLNSFFFAIVLGFGVFIQQKKELASPFSVHSNWGALAEFFLPASFVIILYNNFRLEIAKYWIDLYSHSLVHKAVLNSDFSESFGNPAIHYFSVLWQLNYSLLFLALLGWIAVKKFNTTYRVFIFNLIGIALSLFNIQGLYTLSELRELYLTDTVDSLFPPSSFYLVIRYVCFSIVAISLWTMGFIYKTSRSSSKWTMIYPTFFHLIVLWILSAELIHQLEFSGNMQSYKLGLSILWGSYSLVLILLGIWRKKQVLRIMAIGLFAITLVKLFVYDISHLNSISKTIVFVCLGILLLITSFLYNKYKHLIKEDSVGERDEEPSETNSSI